MEYSNYQTKVIRRYYENQETIMLQKLGELVTELYLAEGKKRAAVWKRIVAALTNLKVPQAKIDQILEKDDPVFLAKFLETKLG